MAAIFTSYPPELDNEQSHYLLTSLKDWTIANGLTVRPAPAFISDEVDPAHVTAVTAPVTLFPSLFPRHCFKQAQRACKAYNELYSAIASDGTWLKPIIEELITVDDFMHGLWDIHLKVAAEGYAQASSTGPVTYETNAYQRLQFGLFRSDYMIHQETGRLDDKATVKQVEFNTIASSFGGLSTRVSGLHSHLNKIEAYPEPLSQTITKAALPPNTTVSGLALGLSKAHNAYLSSIQGNKHPVCVIFVVQNPERNVFDQRLIEHELLNNHSVRSFRLAWENVLRDTKLDEKRTLLYTPPHSPTRVFEVSVVYFRAGYAPSEYETSQAWEARLQLERSAAVKCPSVLLQLAGTKKVQQVLATPHSPHLSKFLPNAVDAQAVQSTFAPIFPLDRSEAGLEARKIATDSTLAQKYVLKPQREGGGNNIYRDAIPEHLKALHEQQWPAYILMEMIEPPAQSNVIFRNGQLARGNVICELGIYGACLWEDVDGVGQGQRKVLENFDAGYLLRTKGADSSEGGVAAGFGSVDSLCLVDV